MVVLLLALLVVVPILELYVFVQLSALMGFVPALVFVIAFSLAGAWLVKREGLGVMRRAQVQLDRGEIPATELVNGLLILLAGVFMLFPGFVTDLVGLVLLVPPTRAMVRVLLLRRFEKRIQGAFVDPGSMSFGSVGSRGRVADVFGGAATGRGRTFTGPATFDVFDVREVSPDDEDRSDGPDRGATGRPELGRY